MVSALTNFDITTSGMSFYKRETTVVVVSNEDNQKTTENQAETVLDNKDEIPVNKEVEAAKPLISGEVIYVASDEQTSKNVVLSDTKNDDSDENITAEISDSVTNTEIDAENTTGVDKVSDKDNEDKTVSDDEVSTDSNSIDGGSKAVKSASESEEGSVTIIDESATNTEDSSASSILETELTDLEEIKVDKLEKTDAKVRNHERAHMNAGGQYAGMAVYEYTEGPDGERYAVAGSVAIDTSEVKNNPKATILKMQIVKRAALAPMEPSTEDRIVAKRASAIESEARAELRETEIKENAEIRQLYQQMINSYGKENVKDFSTFSMIAQDF